jgi:uncharacterized membrane protein (GlpM family)
MDTLAFHIIGAFLVGGFFIAMVTVAAERFGSKIGGFLGGLPSTVFVSILFIGISGGVADAVTAARITPLALTGFSFFVACFFLFARKKFSVGISISAAVWLVIAYTTRLFPGVSIWVGLVISVGCAMLLYLFIYLFQDTLSATGRKLPLTQTDLFSRAIFGGLLIALAVFVSKLAGPVWGGIVGAFPVATLTSLVIVYHRLSLEAARSLAKSILVSAIIVLSVYAVAVYLFYPPFGILWGTVLAYGVTLVTSIPVYIFIKQKLR